jgi:hypothetical protein
MKNKAYLDKFFIILIVLSIAPITVLYAFAYTDAGMLFMYGIQNPEFSPFLYDSALQNPGSILVLGAILLVVNFGSIMLLLVASLHEIELDRQSLKRQWLPTAGLTLVGLAVLAYLIRQFTSGG